MGNDNIKFVQKEFDFAHTMIKMDSTKIKICATDGLEGSEAGLKQLLDLYSDFRKILEDYTGLLTEDLEHIRKASANLQSQDKISGDQFKK